jgi:putative DNA primase/helicase
MKGVFMTLNTRAGGVYPASLTVPAASDWLANGYLPYPIFSGQKNPRYKREEWFSDLSAEKVQQHWRIYPSDDNALYCSNGLVILDADATEAQQAIERLESVHNLHSNLKVKTKKGVHYYYKNSSGLKISQVGHSTEIHPERIDIRCGNSYIIAPPSTDKELLVPEIVPFDQLVALTQEFVDDLNRHNGKSLVPVGLPVALKNPQLNKSIASMDEKLAAIQALIAPLDPDEGYDDWVKVLMAIHHETDGSEEGLAIADEWSSTGGKYQRTSDVEAHWNSFHGRESAVTMGTVRHMLKERGLDANLILRNALGATAKKASGQLSAYGNDVLQPLKGIEFPHQPSGRGIRLPATMENFRHLMTGYGVNIRYNEITKKTVIDIPHLETSIDNADNVKLTLIRSVCALNNFPEAGVERLGHALADLQIFNPVRDWIASTPWDGTDRLDAFYATVVAADDFPVEFKRTLMKRWMISAVAAACESAGFNCRGVLTFTGKQGIGKTSWVKSLVSDEFLRKEVILTGHCLDASNKDSKMTAIQNWIVELGELESTLNQKRELPVLKSFITSDMDTFRRPYAAADSTFPRRTIFFASVNDSNFLNDITGNSRFWSIPVEGVNHQHGLDMQQVFAQVKEQYYDKSEQWWLTDEEEAQLTSLNKDCEVVSPIQEMTMVYLNNAEGEDTNFLTATRFLQVLGIERPNRGEIKEVRAILTERLGKDRKTNGGFRGWDIPMRELY